MQEPKRKVSFKIWSLLIISLLFIGSGIFLKRQYNSVIWAIKDEVIASIPEGERSGDFTYTNQSGRTVTKYILKNILIMKFLQFQMISMEINGKQFTFHTQNGQ